MADSKVTWDEIDEQLSVFYAAIRDSHIGASVWSRIEIKRLVDAYALQERREERERCAKYHDEKSAECQRNAYRDATLHTEWTAEALTHLHSAQDLRNLTD